MKRPAIAVAIVAAAIVGALAGCAAGPLAQDSRNRVFAGNTAAFDLPVTSVLERKFATVVRQQFDFSCGSAALATLLRYHYGEPQTEQTVFVGMWRDGNQEQIRRLGFSLLDMKRYLAARRVQADGYKVSLAQIESTKVPGIALIDVEGYKHFVTIKGVSGGEVLLGDPALGVRRVSAGQFQSQWNGVYFVINSGIKPTAAAFNTTGDHALAPRAGALPFSDPLSIQALALTRPFPGDI